MPKIINFKTLSINQIEYSKPRVSSSTAALTNPEKCRRDHPHCEAYSYTSGNHLLSSEHYHHDGRRRYCGAKWVGKALH